MANFADIDDYKRKNKIDLKIVGKVVHGKKLGRLIDFPTANVLISEPLIIPLPGVYAVKVVHDNQSYFGMMNLGSKPTFDDESVTFEVHMFDFQDDIYGEQIEVAFLKRMRDQKRFESLDDLKNQLVIDKYNVLLFLDTIK
jgi:riboflavin kinase/FMN adenylyltransferase